MIWRGLIFDPYLDAAMGVNVVILGLCGYALENRRLFTAPLLMSVTTAVCLIFTAMVFHVCADDDLVFYICMIYSVILLLIWLAFATDPQSRLARFLHPFLPAAIMTDLQMAEVVQ